MINLPVQKTGEVMPHHSNFAKNLLVILLSTLAGLIVCFALVEVIPLSGKSTVKLDAGKNADGVDYLDLCAHGPCAHPGVFHPHEKVLRPGQADETIYDVTYTIDSDHSRVSPIDSKSSKSGIAVNFFGGSFMFGEGLNDDQTIPHFFTRFVPGTTVKNYGFHGHGVHNSLKLLDDGKVAPAQIHIILTGAYHAPRASCGKDYTMNHPSYRVKLDGKRMSKYVSRCSERDPKELRAINQTGFDALYDNYLAKPKLSKFLLNPVREAYTPKQMELYAAALHDFRQLSEERNAAPVIMYLKEPWHRLLALPDHADPMLEKLDKEGYSWVDVSLAPNFRNVPRQYYIHERNKHPSALANCLRTKLLVDYLVRSKKVIKDSVNDDYACAGDRTSN